MQPFHKQCLICNTISEGPATGQNPGEEVGHISDTGDYMQAIPDAEHPFNVSHGLCNNPDCAEEYERQWFPRIWEQHKAEREAAREAAQQREREEQQAERRRQRRMRRGRKDER